jgi:hypothetical protein
MIQELDFSASDRFQARYRDRWCYDMGGDNTTTSSQTSAPWAPAQGYLTDLMGQAKSLYNQGSQYAPFSTVAPFSDQTLQGLNMTQNIANQGSPNVNAASGAVTNLLQSQNSPGSDVLSQWSNPGNINPYLTGVYNAASRPVIDSINSQFSQAGRTGSTANQNALTDRLGALSANIFGQGYDTAANRSMSSANMLNSNAISKGNQQIAGAALAPSLDAARFAPAQNMLAAGGQYDQKANQYIQDALQRWNYGQDQPWNLLSRYAGNINGLGTMGGTSTGTQTAPTQSSLPSFIGAGVNLLGSPSSNGSSLFSNLLGF